MSPDETTPGNGAPDSPVAADWYPSPNHGERRGGRPIDMVVLHYTGMVDGRSALNRLCDPAAEVSAHYVVEEDGRVLQLVPEARRAWHAGAGTWAGERDINSVSVGIEIVNGGHDHGLPPYPATQIEAVTRLVLDIVGRHHIPPERVLAHSDVAPARKEDPGELFRWDRLAEAGAGHWVPPAPIAPGPSLAPGQEEPDVAALQSELAAYGYDVEVTGRYDQATALVVTAFQRHFRPARVDGVADPSTRATLTALLRSLPGRPA